MTAATWPRLNAILNRLLVIEGGGWADAEVGDLASLLQPGDLLVVNDAATLPASLRAISPPDLEVRLAGRSADEGGADGGWSAVLFGAGDWRDDTDARPAPPALGPGDWIAFAGGLGARVRSVSPLSERLVTLDFDAEGPALWQALYRAGRPVQYSYLADDLPLDAVQTAYAGRPWALEMPSAGRPLTWALLADLRARGVQIAALTHAAGLSATGDPRLDAALPLPERYEIPAATAAAVRATCAAGGRVIAVGTSVVRALEGDRLAGGPGAGVTDLRIGPGFTPRLVDAVLSGMHSPGESHFELLSAFAPPETLLGSFRHAEASGYLNHEFGDSTLVFRHAAAG